MFNDFDGDTNLSTIDIVDGDTTLSTIDIVDGQCCIKYFFKVFKIQILNYSEKVF